MPGGGGHTLCREQFYNNPEYRWYDDPRNDPTREDAYLKVKLVPGHFQKSFADGTRCPPLFDRIEQYLKDRDLHYIRAETEIERIKQDKRLFYLLHELPSNILTRYPKAEIVHHVPASQDVNAIIERHINTSARFPLQSRLHEYPLLADNLNTDYYDMLNYTQDSTTVNTEIHYLAHKNDIKLDEAILLEKQRLVKWYQEHAR